MNANSPTAGEREAVYEAVIALVDKILAAKRADAAADVTVLGRNHRRGGTGIDQHVCRTQQRRLAALGYRLYGLTPEEIKIVEEGTT
ncbi:MAG: hypothetical protein RMK20_10535 [Verrucomicrobiales bacterium]|nr:hypothetical protein [Verrucomicrobiales bacterium]